MSEFRFVHCADLHLGSRFRGVSDEDPVLGERMRRSLFDSFRSVVDLTLSEEASALVISGDLYDDGNELPSTRSFLAEQFSRLSCPVFIARGNHDNATSWDAAIPYPPNVHVFGTDPESVTVEMGDAVFEVTGVSFSQRYETRNLVSLLRGTRGMFTIACVHCDLSTVSEGRAYAPCSPTDFRGRDVDYWALGHIHKPGAVCDDPVAVYSGNIQGRSFKEDGPRGAYLVTVRDGRVAGAELVDTAPIHWHDVSLDITGLGMDGLVSDLRTTTSEGGFVRLRLTGDGPLLSMVCKEPDDFRSALSVASGRTVTSIEAAVTSAGCPDGLASMVPGAAGRMSAAGREAVLGAVRSRGRVPKLNAAYFESLGDAEVDELVREAASLASGRLRA